MLLRILRDPRLSTAMIAAERQSKKSFLDIVAAVLAHFEEILAVINDPAALLALLLALLQPAK